MTLDTFERLHKLSGFYPLLSNLNTVISIRGAFFSLVLSVDRGTQPQFTLEYFKDTEIGYLEYYYRSVEMHSKAPYNICICSVILGQLEPFRNYKGFSMIFPKILDASYRSTKMKIFLIPLSMTFSSSKI